LEEYQETHIAHGIATRNRAISMAERADEEEEEE
jgi:hypothetical protein